MLPIKEYLSHPKTTAIVILQHFGKWLPDRIYLKIMFRLKMGYKLNLRNPKTFSEKLQWLKLYDRQPLYTQLVDKFAVKEYVAGVIGKEYVIPTLGVWDNPEQIDWDSLPDQFVLKTTHGGGSTGVVICKDKSSFNKVKAIENLKESMKQDIYSILKEWPYKNVPRRIIAEQYISPALNHKDLPDYKFFCFNGEPKYCQAITGRNSVVCSDFFDENWVHQPFHEPKRYPFANPEPEKPAKFNLMWNLAKKLSTGRSFSRIDFYNIDDIVYFGEITFFPTGGMGGFSPKEYDDLIGKMLTLPKIKTIIR